jgi:hypothetical protein
MVQNDLVNVYAQFYEKLDSIESQRPLYNAENDLNGTKISEDIFFLLCKIQYIGWKHKILYNRKKKVDIPEIFQDIIAYYMKAVLPKNYEIILEEKMGKTKPDILIKIDGKNYFVVEIKTSVGWHDRINIQNEETFIPYRNKVDSISKDFNILKENIIYIFGGLSNNGKGFSEQYWDNNTRKNRPTQFPYSIIFPLFKQYDPYYWDWTSPKINKDKEYASIKDSEIQEIARQDVISPFEEIIKIILKG